MILLTTRTPALTDALRSAYSGALNPGRGPEAVLSSLRRGLAELGVPFSVNSWRRANRAEAVGVLSGVGVLEEGIRRRSGAEGTRLLAGPNLVTLPSHEAELFCRPEVDVVLVPSPWVKALYESDLPELEGRVEVWPAGVDADFWKPRPAPGGAAAAAGGRAILFVKEGVGQPNASPALVAAARRTLEAAGLSVVELRYGAYSRREYLTTLQAADLMVAFSASESQGIALAEAWSADVPTLVWDQGALCIDGVEYETSSAPYLSVMTGAPFKTESELKGAVELFLESAGTMFAPRDWVTSNLTDEICARRYWELATAPLGSGAVAGDEPK